MNEKNDVLNFWKKISNLIDEKISNLKISKTFKATIWKTNSDNTYSINYKGQLYDVKNAMGTPLVLGQTVWVMIPNGILRNMFIFGSASCKSTLETPESSGDVEYITYGEIDKLFAD